MRKAFLGSAAVGGVVALRQLAKRISQRLHEHCNDAAVQFRTNNRPVGWTS